MPRIRDYDTPQLNLPEQGLSVPSTASTAGASFRGLADVAEAGVGLSTAINQRDTQDEISDLNSAFADERAEWALKIDQQTREQSVDVAKNQEDLQARLGKLSERASTSQSRRYFDSQSARLSGFVLKNSGRGQAQVAGEKAQTSWINALNKNSVALQSDPSGFKDSYDSLLETLNEQIASGVFPPAEAEKFRSKLGSELAKSSIRGWANLSPDQAKKQLEKGTYDEYLSGDERAQMQGYIDQRQTAKEVEERRLLAAEEKAKKLAGEEWAQKALPDLTKGSLQTKAILDSPMSSDDKIKWLKLADESTKKQGDTDYRVYNELVSRAVLPEDDPRKIRSISDLAPFAGKGVSIQDLEKINGFIKKLPESQNVTDNRKRLLDFARAKLARKDSFLGVSDPDGEQNLAFFHVALQNAEAEMREQKKSVASLYDPNSKEYFGNQVGKYQLTPQELLQKQAGRFTREATEVPNLLDVPATSSAQPPALPSGGGSVKSEKVRKPGESAAAFLKRMKKGGE